VKGKRRSPQFDSSDALLDAPATLAERAVALERGGATLRDALRDLLGDPGLEIGFARSCAVSSKAGTGGEPGPAPSCTSSRVEARDRREARSCAASWPVYCRARCDRWWPTGRSTMPAAASK